MLVDSISVFSVRSLQKVAVCFLAGGEVGTSSVKFYWEYCHSYHNLLDSILNLNFIEVQVSCFGDDGNSDTGDYWKYAYIRIFFIVLCWQIFVTAFTDRFSFISKIIV